jgi:hypothetical protein
MRPRQRCRGRFALRSRWRGNDAAEDPRIGHDALVRPLPSMRPRHRCRGRYHRSKAYPRARALGGRAHRRKDRPRCRRASSVRNFRASREGRGGELALTGGDDRTRAGAAAPASKMHELAGSAGPTRCRESAGRCHHVRGGKAAGTSGPRGIAAVTLRQASKRVANVPRPGRAVDRAGARSARISAPTIGASSSRSGAERWRAAAGVVRRADWYGARGGRKGDRPERLVSVKHGLPNRQSVHHPSGRGLGPAQASWAPFAPESASPAHAASPPRCLPEATAWKRFAGLRARQLFPG